MSSVPIVASRSTSGWYLREPFLRSLESLSVCPLDELLHLFGCQCLPSPKFEKRIQQDRSQRHHFRKQSPLRIWFLLIGIRVGQKHLTAPLAQRQTLTLGHSHKLFVFALGHFRANGSIPQLIGRHNKNLREGSSNKAVRPLASEQNKQVNAERWNLAASACSSLTHAA
jgi:hypothetical protein